MFLLAFPLILLAFLGAGAWLLRSLRVETSDVLEETWLAGVLGLLLVGTLATAVGLLGFYTHTGLWLVVAAAILPTFRLWRPLFVGGPWQEQWQELAAAGPLYPALVALLGLFLAFYAFLSLAPNVAWDTMAHHFLVPWMYLREGAIYDLPQVQFSYFPSLLQVTYGLGMGTGGEPAANLLGWWWSAWLLVGILVIGRNLWGWEAGVIGALVMASMEFYGTQLRGGWADAGIALFVLLGGYGPLRWRRTREPGWLYIGALAMGGALAASKHTALLPFGLLVVGMTWWALRRGSSTEPPPPREAEEAAAETAGTGIGLSAVLIYIGLALLPPLAWYIRAYWLTGNPVYPLTFWGLFPGPELPVYAETSWVDQFYERSPFSALTYPFALTIGRSLLDRYQAHLPFQWLLGVPLAWVWRGRSPVVRWWTWLLVATLVAMYRIAPRETRYMLFAVPWLALLTGLGLMLLFRAIPRQVIATALGLVILGGPLIWNQTEVPEALRQTLPVIVKRESRGKYIGRAAPVTGAIARMNRELPADAFVFCLEDRMYRMERDWTNYYAATEPFPQTAEESYTFCYRQGVTHLFLGDGTITHPTIFRNIVDLPPDADGITRFTQGHVMFNIIGDPIDPTKHWVAWFTTRRALQRAGFESRINAEGIEEFSIAHDRLLSTPVQQAHYNVINAIEEMVRRGWLKVLYNNGLTMILEYDYSAIAAYEDPGHFGVGRPKSP